MYWLFSNDNAGTFVIEAENMEEAQNFAEDLFPEEEYGENLCNPKPLTLWEVGMEGYDVYLGR